ncbi:AAA family ATPase [Streptomyces lydicus]|nr:AAA family ATPase [Streptomyces lydicus]MCZ1007039.1 AAA family ATPase [Streptomyces lydicus]
MTDDGRTEYGDEEQHAQHAREDRQRDRAQQERGPQPQPLPRPEPGPESPPRSEPEPQSAPEGRTLAVPDLSLVVLVGATGSGKSTFAARHFRPTEVLSSDFCRGLVSDDENDQSASGDAFEVLHFIAAKRLAAGRLTVVDATSLMIERVQASGEASVARVVRGVGARSGAVGIAAA